MPLCVEMALKDGEGDVITSKYSLNNYDLVIRTQTEFNKAVRYGGWNNAKSVAFVGDGGATKFTLTNWNFNIPSGIKLIRGYNNAIVSITQTPEYVFIYANTSSGDIENRIEGMTFECNLGETGYYTLASRLCNAENCTIIVNGNADNGNKCTVLSKCKNISNCKVVIHNHYVTTFSECESLVNCHVIFDEVNRNSIGYYACERMSCCDVQGTVADDNVDIKGFYDCQDLSSCKAKIGETYEGIITGFWNCKSLSSCLAYLQGRDMIIGFRACTYQSCCRACAISDTRNGGKGYSFYNCGYLSSCGGYGTGASTAEWGGTTRKRDDDSCLLDD